jgi:hypothetical protein
MSRRSRFWWRSLLLLALVVVSVVSVWSWLVQPETTQVGFARIPGGARSSVVLSNQDAPPPRNDPSPAWRMHLRLDHALRPPGPAWSMFEGARPGDGYELHWHPGRLALTLMRGNPGLVLGVVRVDHFPAHVVLARHGLQVEVWVDEVQVLRVLDPQGTPAATSWGFQAAGPMEGSTVSLHDDRRLLDPTTAKALAGNPPEVQRLLGDPLHSDHASMLIRQALGLDAEKNPADKIAALSAANAALASRNLGAAVQGELRQWLAWGEAHAALARQDGEAPMRTAQAVAALIDAAARHPSGESSGLAMELLERLVRASTRTAYRAPEDIAAWRAAWLGILVDCAQAALTHSSSAIPDDWRWQLRLIIHGADCLRGRAPRPTPAEAPEWVVGRWRAFAGGNPGTASFAAIPSTPEERQPLRPALERLIHLAAFEPGGLAAVAMRAAIIDALETPAPPNAGPEMLERQTALNHAQALAAVRQPTAPAREALLAQALLALRGIGNSAEALAALDPDPTHRAPSSDGTVPLARRDALAYALYRLVQHRHIGHTVQPLETPFAPRQRLPPALASQYGRLLDGSPEATHEAWSTDPGVLPATQALAAALAMQEVLRQTRGSDTQAAPNWALLDLLPCFTLPLHLMKPTGDAPDRRPPANPVVVP